jgi:DNA-binding NarL/FixJ family response regulator
MDADPAGTTAKAAREAIAADATLRAAETFRAAAAEASERGATTIIELAEHELRALGVRTWRRTRTSRQEDDPLSVFTERERAVATLIATGASNPEIAKHLFLSRKTVERHVSNALAKAGISLILNPSSRWVRRRFSRVT